MSARLESQTHRRGGFQVCSSLQVLIGFVCYILFWVWVGVFLWITVHPLHIRPLDEILKNQPDFSSKSQLKFLISSLEIATKQSIKLAKCKILNIPGISLFISSAARRFWRLVLTVEAKCQFFNTLTS